MQKLNLTDAFDIYFETFYQGRSINNTQTQEISQIVEQNTQSNNIIQQKIDYLIEEKKLYSLQESIIESKNEIERLAINVCLMFNV